MEDKMRLGVVNMQARSGNKAENLEKILFFIEAAAKEKIDLLLFPELALHGYDYFIEATMPWEAKHEYADTLDSKSCMQIKAVAMAHGIHIVYGMAEKKANKMYNAAVLLNPKKDEVVSYHKIHPYDKENMAFTKGKAPLLWETKWGKIGIGICYDTYQFPELARYYAHKGARLYLNPTALAEGIKLPESREAFLSYYRLMLEYNMRTTTMYYASANLVGQDKESYFGGASVILGPKETPFSKTAIHYYGGDLNGIEERLYAAEIDLSLVTRRLFVKNEYANEPDYRPEVYHHWDID